MPSPRRHSPRVTGSSAISRTPDAAGVGELTRRSRPDVTDRAAVFAAVEQAVAHFGRLDIVVNNAGAMSLGVIEEFSEDEARAQMEVNFFGALWVTQAVPPQLRAQRGGHSCRSRASAGSDRPDARGSTAPRKFALEGMSEALAQELAPVRRPRDASSSRAATGPTSTAPACTSPSPGGLRGAPRRATAEEESVDSEPRLAAEAMLKLVDSDDPPLRLLLGSAVLDAAIAMTKARIDTWERWEDVSRAAEHAGPDAGGVYVVT